MFRDAESRVVVACQIDSRNASQQHTSTSVFFQRHHDGNSSDENDTTQEKKRVGDFFILLGRGSTPGLGEQFGTRVRVWDGSELVV